MSSKDKGVLYYDDSSHKKNKKDSCKSQCCCKNVNENPCDCMPQWQKGDQYLSGFHVNGNIYQFDNLEIPIPTTEGEFARISNIPLNCNNKVVWLNITAGVINRSAANERFVFFRVYRNSIAPENLIASASDSYGLAAGAANHDVLDMTHIQVIDPNPGQVGSTVTYIITYQANGADVRLNGPRVATASVIGECR